jgi:hypothetical protein
MQIVPCDDSSARKSMKFNFMVMECSFIFDRHERKLNSFLSVQCTQPVRKVIFVSSEVSNDLVQSSCVLRHKRRKMMWSWRFMFVLTSVEAILLTSMNDVLLMHGGGGFLMQEIFKAGYRLNANEYFNHKNYILECAQWNYEEQES